MNDGTLDESLHTWQQIRDWRRQTRTALIERRIAMQPGHRKTLGTVAKQRLRQHCELSRYPTLGIYWPFRGEIDVRDIAREHLDNGCKVALPVVVAAGQPLEFWNWHPDMKLAHGVWNIPIPPQRDPVQPDALIVPLLGFDVNCFRLGYGGGYYDRTIAAAAPRPYCIGLGYAESQLTSIHPQPHDIAMDIVVTDERVMSRQQH